MGNTKVESKRVVNNLVENTNKMVANMTVECNLVVNKMVGYNSVEYKLGVNKNTTVGYKLVENTMEENKREPLLHNKGPDPEFRVDTRTPTLRLTTSSWRIYDKQKK